MIPNVVRICNGNMLTNIGALFPMAYFATGDVGLGAIFVRAEHFLTEGKTSF